MSSGLDPKFCPLTVYKAPGIQVVPQTLYMDDAFEPVKLYKQPAPSFGRDALKYFSFEYTNLNCGKISPHFSINRILTQFGAC